MKKTKTTSGAPSGKSRRLPSTTRPPGTASSRSLALYGREEAHSTPGGRRGTPRRGIASRAKKLKLLLLDVDGVLTDGSIILDGRGNELKAFHVRDGHGIKLAQKNGITIGIITGRKSDVVAVRARELGIQEVHQGAHEKIAIYESLLEKYGLRDDETAFIGDDVVDIGILRRTGIAAAVSDADPAVKPYVDVVLKTPGGRGAVREFINLVLKNRPKPQSS